METTILHIALFIMGTIAFYQILVNLNRRKEYSKDQETLKAIFDILSEYEHRSFDILYSGASHEQVYSKALSMRDTVNHLREENKLLRDEILRLRQMEGAQGPMESGADYKRKVTDLTLQLEDKMKVKFDKIIIEPYSTYKEVFRGKGTENGYHIHIIANAKEITTTI